MLSLHLKCYLNTLLKTYQRFQASILSHTSVKSCGESQDIKVSGEEDKNLFPLRCQNGTSWREG